jgi:hypothetical protein
VTTYYVDDDGSNTDPFDTLAKASTTLQGLFTAKAIVAGDLILVRSTHVEGGSNVTFSETATDTQYTLASIDGSENYESMTTGGGTIDMSGTYQNLDSNRIYGLIFEVGAFHVVCQSGNRYYAKDCVFDVVSSVRELTLGANYDDITARFDNCTFAITHASTARYFDMRCDTSTFEFNGCTFDTAAMTTATYVFNVATNDGCSYTFNGCTFNSGVNPILSDLTADQNNSIYRFRNCTFTSGYTITPTMNDTNSTIICEDCSSGTISAPEFGYSSRHKHGDISTEKTSVRTGGAAVHGVTYSHKFVSTSLTSEAGNFLEGPPIAVRVPAGASTLTIHIASSADMNDDDIWVDVLSPDEAVSETAAYDFVSTAAGPTDTPAAYTTDTGAVWGGADTGTDGGTGQQIITVSINPAQAGKAIVRAYLAKPSTTAYVCPLVEVT